MLAQTAALADGGTGGAAGSGLFGGGGAGGTGAAGGAGNAGGDNSFYGSGGGGGGAAGGGTGGQGGSSSAGTHAAGGTSGSPDGATGDDQVGGDGGSGGGGGYGGDHGTVAASIVNTSPISGGNGGNGGTGGAGGGTGGGGGGGGGAGGYGAVVNGTGSSSNSGGGTITGGTGGTGGAGGNPGAEGGNGGDGGDGGDGVALTGSAITFTNSSTVTGGAGGNGGAGGAGSSAGGFGGNGGKGGAGISGASATIDNLGTITGGAGGLGGAKGGGGFTNPTDGADGAGGAGIVGSDLTIVNSGTIGGGLGGDGVTRANAITFTGGDNKITFGNATSGLTGNVDVTGTLTFDQSANDVTIGNTITGTGSIAKTGIATVTLSGTNSYSGGTTVRGGTLAITNADALGSGNVAFENGTTLVLDGTGIDLANDVTVAGDPTIFVDTGNADTISGTIADGATAGDLVKTGGGTLTLSGANTYSGGTTISEGTLQVTNDSSVGTGKVTLDGGTFQAGASTLTFTNDFAVNTTGGTVDTNGGNTLTLGGISDGDGTGGTLTILNSGADTGVVMIGAASDYSGATTVGDGTGAVVLEAIGGANLLSANSAVTVKANSFLNTGGNDQTIGSLAGAGTVQGAGSTVQTLTTGGDDSSTTFSGVINNGGGTLALTKEGTGTFTLSGTNTYTGGTTVTGGTLAITNADALGSGALALKDGTAFTLDGDGDGDGIDFANDMTVAGDTTVTVDTSNSDTLSGTISDGTTAGSVTKAGTGTLTLSGTNTYTGGTTVTGGTLAITNADALGTGNLALEDGTGFTLDGTGIDFANDMTVAGDTTVTVATGNTDTLSGTISDGMTSGGIFKNGAGTLILSATNSYTDATTVDEGTLNVTGSIASSSLTTVNTGATLIGTGTVGNLEVASGGTFAPGAAGVAGTSTTVSGTLTLDAGSTYVVAVNPATASYADVSGTASLHGTVLAAFDTGTYVTKQYIILQSTGLGGTTFDALTTTDLPSGFIAKLEYTSNNALLDLTAVLGIGGNLNGNQQHVADGLNTYFNNGGSTPPNFLTIFGLSGGNLANALSGLSGEAATGASVGSFQMMSSFFNLFSGTGGTGAGTVLSFAPAAPALPAGALAYAPTETPAPASGGWTLWGAGFGGASRTSGDAVAGTHTVDASDYGFAVGADYQATPDTVFGVAAAVGGTNWDLSQSLGGGDSDALQIGLRAERSFGPAYLSGALGFANHWMTIDRYASGDRLTSDFTAQVYAGRVEAGYRLSPAASLGVTPYAALAVQHFRAPAHSETDLGGGGFALSYEAMSVTDTRSELGLRLDHATMLGADRLTLTAGGAWAHDHQTDPSATAGFEALPGSSFTVSGAKTPQNLALVSAGMELDLASNLTLSAKADGELGSGYQSFGGTGVLRYSW